MRQAKASEMLMRDKTAGPARRLFREHQQLIYQRTDRGETKTKSQKLVLVAEDNTVNQDLAKVLEKVSDAGGKSQSDEVILLEEVAPVDLKRLYESMGEEPEELFDILGIYLDQMSHNLKRLGVALESEDADEIDLIAHNCCGVSANCGMTAVVAPLRELERMGRENCLQGSKVLGAQVSSEFERIKVFLDENLAHLVV